MATTGSEYAITEFITVQPGEPFRLLPFGRLVKGGKAREITADVAARFRLPHFRPAIKLGSHAAATPAGGHIVGLEVREDGLYAVPEYNDEGAAALARGAYRYHSPEIVWEGGLEDPRTGVMQGGPLIVGDALLHTPHLGEAAALYAAEITQEGVSSMTTDMVSMPASLWERILTALTGKGAGDPEQPPAPELAPNPAPEPAALAATVNADQYAALQANYDALSAQVEQMKAAQARAGRVEHFASELVGTALAGDAELPGLLAGLDDAAATALTTRLKALAEQGRVAALTADVGHEGQTTTGDPTAALDAAIRTEMTKEKIDYNAALTRIRAEQPGLVAAAYGGQHGR